MQLIDKKLSRREFLIQSGQTAMGGLAAPWLINMAGMGEAAAFSASDYKALVCVFLFGGNDYANTVVNFDNDSYAKYLAIRGANAGSNTSDVVMQQAALAATELRPGVPLANGLKYALHPSMPGLAGLFNSGKAAVQLNIGPLIVPVTRAQYNLNDFRNYPLPPKLFSHNDQQSTWQSFAPEGATAGWGGKIGDVTKANNTDPLFTCVSLTGNNVFLSGVSTQQYQLSSTGSAILVNPATSNFFGQAGMRTAFVNMLQQQRSHILENLYYTVTRNSMLAATQVNQGLSTVVINTAFPAGSGLAAQMKTVAQMIGARNALGAKRQVFMVSLGGFDHHDYLGTRHAPLLQQVDQAMTAFYQATVELGVANQVTAFTASDFGRTLSLNGDGSDHGWGSHHLVVGGAVQGAAFYGTPPPVSVGNTSAQEDQWHVGQGRLLPSTSVDQFAATLARWFGVSDNELQLLLPNLRNFGVAGGRPDYPVNLGFLGGPVI
jgi:uncharacterized protein (DUF1501 family)